MCTYFSVFKAYVLLKEITFHKKNTFYQRITIHKARNPSGFTGLKSYRTFKYHTIPRLHTLLQDIENDITI